MIRQRVLVLALLLGVRPVHGQDLRALRARIEGRIAQAPAGAAVGLYYRSLPGSDSLLVNAHARFHAASTMKVAGEVPPVCRAAGGRAVPAGRPARPRALSPPLGGVRVFLGQERRPPRPPVQ